MPMEISKGNPQLSDLQTKGNCTNHEELDLQRSSISKEEQQEDFISLYLPITSNIDKKYNNDEEDHANAFSNRPFYDECESDPDIKGNDQRLLDLSTIFSPASRVEKQFEEPLVSILKPEFKKNSNGEEENASPYDEYDEDIEFLDWKFHDQQKPIVGEL